MRHFLQANRSDVAHKVKFYIGNVRDRQAVDFAMASVDYVFAAAALKQVPSCEFFPMEAVRTNVEGTNNVLLSAIAHEVKNVVVLSTDKAAYPINAMGISKAMMEKVALNFTLEYNKDDQSVSLCSHHRENHYMNAFLQDMILRPSCYKCQAKSGRSHSDIILADFWGIKSEMPEMDDDKGTGLVLVNTCKGQAALDWSKTNHKETTADVALGHNLAYFRSVAAHSKRAYFFARIDET